MQATFTNKCSYTHKHTNIRLTLSTLFSVCLDDVSGGVSQTANAKTTKLSNNFWNNSLVNYHQQQQRAYNMKHLRNDTKFKNKQTDFSRIIYHNLVEARWHHETNKCNAMQTL